MTSGPNPIAAKADFPDWLSPMLVKELRQGMRSRVFLISFILLQVAMIFLALIGLLNAASDESNSEITVYFWMIIGVPLMIIMPSAGLGAISAERVGNTLDSIFLTRMTARRVLIGKWLAIVAQTLLLVTATLPYAVLRYYLGSVDLVMELIVLAWMTAGSALLSALAVGISPGINRLGQILIPVVAIIGSLIGTAIFSGPMGPVVRGGGSNDWSAGIAFILLGCVVAAFMLEVGAARIAPKAENHATPKRLCAIIAVLIAICYSAMPGDHAWIWTPASIIGGLAMIGAMCEPVCEIPSVYQPFLRRGLWGRLCGLLFYPGWPSGFFFSVLIIAMIILGINYEEAVAHGLSNPLSETPALIMEMAFIGTLFLPSAVYHLARPKRPSALVFYVGFLGLSWLIAILGMISAQYGSHGGKPSGLEVVLSSIPSCVLFHHQIVKELNDRSQTWVFLRVSVVTLLSMIALLVRMRPAWRSIGALEKRATMMRPVAPSPDVAEIAPAA
jgi:hypothetical protein